MKIKFLSINIWIGGKLFDNLVTFLRKENPDILSMQEVFDGKNEAWNRNFRALTELKKALNYQFISFAPEYIDTRSIGDIEIGNAIFSKFPIINQNAIFYNEPYGKFDDERSTDFSARSRNLLEIEVKIDEKNLSVFNTHGVWGFDGDDNKRRLKMSETIVSQIKDKEQVILSGDFNTMSQTQSMQNIETHLRNVFKNELSSTFNMKHKNKPGYATSVVDMIYVSPHFQILDHYCPKEDVSDHLPLVCVLEI